jgi:hypothetical protein
MSKVTAIVPDMDIFLITDTFWSIFTGNEKSDSSLPDFSESTVVVYYPLQATVKIFRFLRSGSFQKPFTKMFDRVGETGMLDSISL